MVCLRCFFCRGFSWLLPEFPQHILQPGEADGLEAAPFPGEERLVFLLYAEDAGLLQHHGALYDYLKPIPVPQMRQAIIDLFRVLDTPDGSGGTENKRDPYLAPKLLEFPYINGGLFSEENIIVPQFTDQIKS